MRLLARASVRLGRDASAMSLFERLGPQLMTADDFYLLGVALSRSGNRRAASRCGSRDCGDPDHPEILDELTRVYLEADRFNDAAPAAGRLAKHPDWRARADACWARSSWPGTTRRGPLDSWRRAMGTIGVAGCRRLRAAGHPERPGPGPAPRAGGRPRPATISSRSWQGARRRGLVAPEPRLFAGGALAEALAALKDAGSFADEDPTLPDPAPFVGAAQCAVPPREVRRPATSPAMPGPSIGPPSSGTWSCLGRSSPTRPTEGHPYVPEVGDRLEQETHTPDPIFQAPSSTMPSAPATAARHWSGAMHRGRQFELRLSVYREGEPSVWDVTTGQPRHPSKPGVSWGCP